MAKPQQCPPLPATQPQSTAVAAAARPARRPPARPRSDKPRQPPHSTGQLPARAPLLTAAKRRWPQIPKGCSTAPSRRRGWRRRVWRSTAEFCRAHRRASCARAKTRTAPAQPPTRANAKPLASEQLSSGRLTARAAPAEAPRSPPSQCREPSPRRSAARPRPATERLGHRPKRQTPTSPASRRRSKAAAPPPAHTRGATSKITSAGAAQRASALSIGLVDSLAPDTMESYAALLYRRSA